MVQGDTNFWPVGIAVAQDGSLFVTDWASRSYPLHGEGKVWRLKSSQAKQETTTRKQESPIAKQIGIATRMRDQNTSTSELVQFANNAETIELRAMAVRLLGKRGHAVQSFAGKDKSLPIRREALRYLKTDGLRVLADGLKSKDAVLRSLAVRSLARNHEALPKDWFATAFLQSPPEGEEQLAVGAALACECINGEELQAVIPSMLKSENDDVRFVAARWVADHKLEAFLPDIQAAIGSSNGGFRLLLALVGAEQHLNGGKLNDETLTDALSLILADESKPLNTKLLALKAANTNSIDIELIKSSLDSSQKDVQREAVYLLLDDPREEAISLLNAMIDDDAVAADLRADALTVADRVRHDVERLVSYASYDSDEIRLTAVRLLTGEKLTEDQRARLPEPMRKLFDSRSVKQLKSVEEVLPSLSSSKAKGDSESGRRLFHNTRLLQCAKCHRVANRGANIGPELTGIAKTQSTEQLLRSIIHPSERIAPQYQTWTIIDQQGRSQTGYHLASKSLVETFVDSNGEQFEVAQDDIEQRIAGKQSIMPAGLIDHLTDQEVSDLFAYLSE